MAYTYALGIAWRFDSSHEDLYQDTVLIYQTREIQPPVSLTKHSEITDSTEVHIEPHPPTKKEKL